MNTSNVNEEDEMITKKLCYYYTVSAMHNKIEKYKHPTSDWIFLKAIFHH